MSASNRAGSFGLYTMNPDGPIRGSCSVKSSTNPGRTLSPDGRRIAFVRSVGIACCGPTADIYIGNADGSDIERLTPADPQVDDYRRQWSPDGSQVAFVSNRDGTAASPARRTGMCRPESAHTDP